MTRLSAYLWSLVLAASFLSTPAPVKAGQIEIVTNTLDDGPGSLREAISLVDDQGEVLFDEAIQGQTIVLTSGSLRLTKDMSILCPIDNRVTITAQGISRLFYQIEETSVTIEGLNLTKGAILDPISDNYSLGGAIYSQGVLNINFCDITNSQAIFGGAIYGHIVYLTSSNITDNIGVANGGGIYAAELTAQKSTIGRNQALGRSEKRRTGLVFIEGNAGGIRASEKLYLYQCTIAENKCGGLGGGIFTSDGSSTKKLSIISCNISKNQAGQGGGIYNDGFNIESLSNNLIVQNESTASSPDLYTKGLWEDVTTVHHNIISAYTDSQSIPGSENQIGTTIEPINVMLAPLQNYGGPTLTSPFVGCSSALNAGDDSHEAMDQTGNPRIVGDQADIGPWEHQNPDTLLCDENPLKKYVIIATSEVILSNRNTVINGGVGVLNSNGVASISRRSRVTATSTFVEAPTIIVNGGSHVTTLLYQEPTLQIPSFKANNSSANNSVIIASGTTQTLSDGAYKDVTVRTGGTVIFESNQVFIEDLNIQRNGSVIVSDCTELIIKNRVTLGINSKINIDNNRLSIFAKDVRISNGSNVYADIQASVEIRARGRSSNPIYLYGLFIAPRIDGRNYVNWNWNPQEPCGSASRSALIAQCDDFKVDAGRDVSVLNNRFSFFNNSRCISLAGVINDDSGSYTYEWTPSNSLSDPRSLTPIACPTTDTEYILTAKNEDGCSKSDTVLVKAILLRDLFNQPRCDNRRFWVRMCNPITQAEVCASIFSTSSTLGVGPLLNQGFTIGSCLGLTPRKDDIGNESQKTNAEFKIWPTPSYGSINFSIGTNLKNRIIELTVEKSEASNVYSKTYKASDFNADGVLSIRNLNSGYYNYKIISDFETTESGKFLVKDNVKN